MNDIIPSVNHDHENALTDTYVAHNGIAIFFVESDKSIIKAKMKAIYDETLEECDGDEEEAKQLHACMELRQLTEFELSLIGLGAETGPHYMKRFRVG